ncbi:MAG TPA: adenylate/guanylate cyclase domain-containing protein [Burkholderiales bacterium]|nr:adenylate/guanylate cyclase domain-containing protein [Burkholderiales bacterium]
MLFLVGQALGLYPVRFVNQLDNFIYDARLAMTMPRGVESRIVILDIDEKSLGELGHWPWSRNLMTELVDKLFERHGIALLAFDVLWAEHDASSGIDALDRLARELPQLRQAYAKLRPELDFDGRFAASMKGRPVVLAYYFNSEARAVRANAIPKPVLPAGSFEGRLVDFHHWHGYTGNLPAYLESAAAAGHINQLADADGVLRRLPLLVEFDGAYYEAFSLAVFRMLLAKSFGTPPAIEPGFKDDALETLKVGPFEIPVDETAAALVPYRGRKSFEYLPLADVLRDRVAVGSLKDKIVLVGATASTLGDQKSTPVDNVLPGVEVHANMLAGLLDQDFKRRPWYTLGAEVVLLLVGGTVLALLIPMLSALWATLAVTAGTALIVAFNVAVWQHGGLVLPLASSLLMVLALYTMNMAYGYFVESRSKRQFAELFGQYVPPELVRQMARDPRRYNMAPRSAELTILFSDVRGFTGISEALSPEALREFINDYLTTMSEIIRGRHRGTLDKYIGDAIMAFWGAPVEDPQQARNAVLAALDMQEAVATLNQRFAARGWPRLAIGVGINSGTVRVGDMGSKLRRAYTAMGDAVNVASRLEGRTKHYGVGILVGERTRQRLDDVAFREIDRIKLKGKDEAITIYEPLGLAPRLDEQKQEELRIWAQALRAYRSRNWDLAEVNLHNLQRIAPACMLYAMYAERVRNARATPMTADWEPVTVFDEK